MKRETNSYHKRIAEYLTNKVNQTMKFGQLIEYLHEKYFSKK